MKNRVKYILLFAVIVSFGTSAINAQECRDNYNKAEEYRKKGQYSKAINFYKKSRDCGDVNYKAKSISMIEKLNATISEKENVNKSQPYIIVPSLIYVSSNVEEQIVTVESSGTWVVKESSKSLTAEKKTPKSLSILPVTPNLSIYPRVGEIAVECGELVRTVTVVQDGAPEKLVYKSKYMNVPFKGGQFVVDIETNTRWTVDYADWYKATPMNDDSTRMVIMIDKNTKNEDRNGTIVVRSKSGESYDVMEIRQHANESIIFSPVDSILQFSAKRDTAFVPIVSDNPNWTESDLPSWCMAKKINSDTLMIVVCENEIEKPRDGFVHIKSGDRVANISVRQEPAPYPDFMVKRIVRGRNLSVGLTGGFLYPMISCSSSGKYMGSPVNYGLGTIDENAAYSSTGGFIIGTHADIRLHKNLFLITGLNFVHYNYQNDFSHSYKRTTCINEQMGWYMEGVIDHNLKEKYTMSLLEIPILASYKFPISDVSHLQFNVGPVINYGTSALMKVSGDYDSEKIYKYKYINHQKTNDLYDNGSYSVHRTSNGEFNLYDNKAKYSEIYVFENYEYNEPTEFMPIAPFKKINFSACMGMAFEYKGVSLGLEYNVMLLNMANKKYWESDRWLIFGQKSTTMMSNYMQKNNYLNIKLGYTFRY